jgi:Sec-independent protein translocase protein TatA
VWGAGAAASTSGAVALRLTSASDTRRWAIVVVPAAALLVIGPVAQWALGLPWSNYGGGTSGPHALVLVVVVALGFAAVGLRRAVRGLGRRIDRRAVRRDLQPGGDDGTPRHRTR